MGDDCRESVAAFRRYDQAGGSWVHDADAAAEDRCAVMRLEEFHDLRIVWEICGPPASLCITQVDGLVCFLVLADLDGERSDELGYGQ